VSLDGDEDLYLALVERRLTSHTAYSIRSKQFHGRSDFRLRAAGDAPGIQHSASRHRGITE